MYGVVEVTVVLGRGFMSKEFSLDHKFEASTAEGPSVPEGS